MPANRLRCIGSNSPTKFVAHSDIEACFRMPLLRRGNEPPERTREVSSSSKWCRMHRAQPALCLVQPLRRCGAVQSERLRVIQRKPAPSVPMQRTEHSLTVPAASSSTLASQLQRARVMSVTRAAHHAAPSQHPCAVHAAPHPALLRKPQRACAIHSYAFSAH